MGAIRLVRGAGVIDDSAAGERVGGNVHAVVVAISVHDGVAEGQGVGGVVFRRKPGGTRDVAPGTAQFQFQHRALVIHDLATDRSHFDDVRRFAEDHLHFNGLAGCVGVADLRRGCDAQALDGWRLIVVAGIHFVRRLHAQRLQPTAGGVEDVAGAVRDRAIDERVGADGDAVVVEVAGLHGVAKHERCGSAAGTVGGGRRAAADGEAQTRVGVHPHRFVERHMHLDHLAGAVGLVSVRRRLYGDAGDAGGHRVHAVPGLVGQRRKRDARGVFPTPQRVGLYADAVVVGIAFLDDVLEGQQPRALGHQPRRLRRGAHLDQQLLRGAAAEGTVQEHFDDDGVANTVGPVRSGIRGDRGDGAGGHAVHFVSGLIGQRHAAQDGVVANDVLHLAATNGVGVDAHAVGVGIAVLHGVGEGQGVRGRSRKPRGAPAFANQ